MNVFILLKKIQARCLLYWNIHKNKSVRKSYGPENPDKTFYVVSVDYDTQGLFAIVKNVLSHIEIAVDKGYIPVVDMQNYRSQFQTENKENVWELFFQQPCGYTLEDIKYSKNIIISKNITNWGKRSIFPDIVDFKHQKRRDKIATLYKKFIRPNVETDIYIKSKYQKIIGDKKNVLGVLCRGTDYIQKHPHGHPVQPDFPQIVEKIEELDKKYLIDYIYVATEDEKFMELFREKYHEKILFIDQQRFGKMGVNYISDLGLQHADLIKLNLDYYSSLYILSKCDYFIGGRTAGMIGVSLMGNHFNEFFSWDLGKYKD